ncbi:MAG: alpha/beta hydrolase [Acidimicrobiales bacterium]|jgi:3-oxoadipate enol-lactonase|nr:alpha/beta hydrolase [Acidimicrobiales bacterium]
MPKAVAADGTRLHYEVTGRPDGEPVLMIQGLGADSKGWIRQRRAFAARHRVIVFDNRGVGRSDKPEGPYDLAVMAADALAVLDDVGVATAHVMGASMGGVLSQFLAVTHPDRLRSVTLACTAARHHQWRRELLGEWAELARTKGMGAVTSKAAKWLVGQRSFHRLRPAVNLLGPLALSTTQESFVAQVEAILSMDEALRFELRQVRLPTFVIVGSQDILTPLGDSEEIASMVPGAELAIIGGAAHGLMVEHASTYNRLVLDFLDRVIADRPSEPVRPRPIRLAG